MIGLDYGKYMPSATERLISLQTWFKSSIDWQVQIAYIESGMDATTQEFVLLSLIARD